MVDEGRAFIQVMVNDLTASESAQGVRFLSRVSEIIDTVHTGRRAPAEGRDAQE
jgi:hypothetical protein